MNTLCKTPKGTIGAFRWNNGIALGTYGKGNFISLEYNRESDEMVVLICRDKMESQGFKMKFVDREWCEKF